MRDEFKKIKMQKRNHFEYLWGSFIFLLISITIIYFSNFNQLVTIIFLSAWLIDLLIALPLHLQYYKFNKNFTVLLGRDFVEVEKDNVSKKYFSTDIKYINLFMGPNILDGFPASLTFDEYFYAEIVLNSDESLILTSLLSSTIDVDLKILEGIEIKKQNKLYCIID